MEDYPTHVVVFWAIGLYVTLWAGLFGTVFAVDRTLTALLRRRRARTTGGNQ